MALPLINLGTNVETGDGDQLRMAFGKANAYFADHETRISANEVRLSGLGSAATLNVGTTTGTLADGGALTAEISRAQAAEALLAPLASPAFTGTPSAPTPTTGDNSQKLATTAYVQLAVAGGGVAAVIYSGSQALTPTQQATARGNIAAAASGANADITSLAAPALGAATAATAAPGTATAQVANTAFVANALGNYLTTATASSTYAPLASPALTGTPTAPTPAAGDNSQKVATTAYADRAASNVRALSFRNRIVNGNFGTNQGLVSGTVTLAAGAYGHDKFKAGAGGCTYTFSTAANGDTTLTITAGTLLQVIEGGLYLPEGGAYVLSWTGTSTARVYQGAASGSYAASPVAVAGLTAGTNTSVEFGTGTLGLVQFEPGTQATTFERRDDELRRCRRYARLLRPSTGRLYYPPAHYADANQLGFGIVFEFPMRAPPTIAQFIGTANTDYLVCQNGNDQTGFSFTASVSTEWGVQVFASKTSHGLPAGSVLVDFEIKPTGGLLLRADL